MIPFKKSKGYTGSLFRNNTNYTDKKGKFL